MNNILDATGLWWVPDAEGKKISGRLIINVNKNSELTLTCTEHDIGMQHIFREYDVIHGLTSDGQHISLLDCFDLSVHKSNGITERTIFANYALVGGLVPDTNKTDTFFSKLVLKWSGLKSWFLKSGLNISFDDNYRSFTLTGKPQEIVEVRYSDKLKIKFKVDLESKPLSVGIMSEDVMLKEFVWVVIESEEPKAFQYFLSIQAELIHFFSLCMLTYSEPEEIKIVGNFDIHILDGKEYPPYMSIYFATSRKMKSDKLVHPFDMLVTYKEMENEFQSILSKWHELSDMLSPAIALYFSSLYGERYIESTFLSLAQAAEVFHRRYYGGTYLDSQTYDSEVRSLIAASIPTHLPQEVKDLYRIRIGFLNEYSLNKRLKQMAMNHESIFKRYIPEWKKEISAIRDARNYYTHYTESETKHNPEMRNLSRYVELLRMLIELEMIKCCGVDLSSLHEAALKCQRYASAFRR